MGLQQFERRLERVVEGVFAKAFRSGLQPVEIGRRITREMDLRRTLAPRGTLVPNSFVVVLSPHDHDRFAPIEDELVSELVSVAREHARADGYVFLGPVAVTIEVDTRLSPGRMLVSGEMSSAATGGGASLLLPEGRRLALAQAPVVLGRLPDCQIVVSDPNVSRRHAEIRPSGEGGWELADLGSTNGTRLNGARIHAAVPLRPGDQVTVGSTTITFENA